MINKIQDGQTIDYTASAAKLSGAVVVIGVRIGVCVADIAIGETGSIETSGVFELPKKASDTFAIGALCYWDDTNKYITSTTTNNTLSGFATEAAAGADTVVRVKINA